MYILIERSSLAVIFACSVWVTSDQLDYYGNFVKIELIAGSPARTRRGLVPIEKLFVFEPASAAGGDTSESDCPARPPVPVRRRIMGAFQFTARFIELTFVHPAASTILPNLTCFHLNLFLSAL